MKNLYITKELPLLNELVDIKGSLSLSNTILFAVQHLLGSNIPLFLILNKLGIDFSNMFIIGKTYSSNPVVISELQKLGAYVHPDSLKIKEISLRRDYRTILSKSVTELFKKLEPKFKQTPKPKRLLILDDGAVGISIVNHYRNNIDADVIAIEETRSGAEIIKGLNKISFPVIDVAESKAKLIYESPFIANSIIQKLSYRLKDFPIKINLKKAKVLVVGFGALGSEVAKRIRKINNRIMVYDLDDKKIHEASKSGFIPIDLEKQLIESEIIIGCVGKSWLPVNAEEIIRNDSILISGSSSNVEFLGLEVDNNNFLEPIYLGNNKNPDLKRVHGDYKVKLKNGTCWILNAGFPVNFDGSIDPISPQTIQFTRALMLAGIFQAIEVRSKQQGLIPLEEKSQEFIINRFQEINR